MTIGTSHGTSKFACDKIKRVRTKHLELQYPGARTMVILCDGRGANSSSFNPIEHRLFSQITRNSLLTMEDAVERARRTATSKGLTVYVDINDKTLTEKSDKVIRNK